MSAGEPFAAAGSAGLSRVRRRLPTVRGARGAAVVLGVVALAVVLPFLLNAYWLRTFVFIEIAALAAVGLNVLTGHTGQVSLGHAFFLAVGAYTAAYLGGDLGLTAAVWIPAAGLMAGIVGAIVGPTALRLRGLYLAIVTIALIYIGQHIWINWGLVSGGPGGRSFPPPTFGSFSFANGLHVGNSFINSDGLYYYLTLLLLALAMLFVRNLGRSRAGRSMLAVRDRELAAAVLGVDVARTKVTAFVVSSAIAGVAGALYASYLTFVVPTAWNLLLSITYVIMIVVGGLGTVWGPVLGAVFVVGLPSLFQDVSGSLPFLASGSNSGGVISPADLSTLVYAAILIAFLVLEPRGVIGLVERLASIARRRR